MCDKTCQCVSGVDSRVYSMWSRSMCDKRHWRISRVVKR